MLENINKSFGVKLFKNPNTLNYNLFNFFYKKFINYKKNENQLIAYHNLGYIKPNIDSKNLAIFLSNKIKSNNVKKIKEISNDYSTAFEIDDEMNLNNNLLFNPISRFSKYCRGMNKIYFNIKNY